MCIHGISTCKIVKFGKYATILAVLLPLLADILKKLYSLVTTLLPGRYIEAVATIY